MSLFLPFLDMSAFLECELKQEHKEKCEVTEQLWLHRRKLKKKLGSFTHFFKPEPRRLLFFTF